MLPRLAITMGDINGIGPEILWKALLGGIGEYCAPVVVGSRGVLERAMDRFSGGRSGGVLETVTFAEPEGVHCPDITPGTLSAEAGECAVRWLRTGIEMALAGEVAGIVTCPLNKEGIHLAGYSYAGHTEIIAEMCGVEEYRMSLFGERLRVVHVTSHCSLREAVNRVDRERIASSIRLADEALRRLCLARRRVAVAGLNPHSGEAGAFGDEEKREIAPAIEMCIHEGYDCAGPFAPDTVFRRMLEGEFDIVVAMYHDQGHIPVKLIEMDDGVNVTLGIPLVRTSVDHGTAYEIAWQGQAREDSLCAAVRLAALLAKGGAGGE